MSFLAVVAALWLFTESLAGLSDGWLAMVPALLLALPLLCGRYVGEELLVQWAERTAPPRRRVRARVLKPRGPRVIRRGGGLLGARRLAGRAPPAIS